MAYKYAQAQAEQREVETARRAQLIKDLGEGDDYKIGAVLRWTRRYGSKDYSFAALKAGSGRWFVTGSTMISTDGWIWEALVEWMTTGNIAVENVMVSESWMPISEYWK
jgi:hypothetical protein